MWIHERSPLIPIYPSYKRDSKASQFHMRILHRSICRSSFGQPLGTHVRSNGVIINVEYILFISYIHFIRDEVDIRGTSLHGVSVQLTCGALMDWWVFYVPRGLKRDFCSPCSPRHAFSGAVGLGFETSCEGPTNCSPPPGCVLRRPENWGDVILRDNPQYNPRFFFGNASRNFLTDTSHLDPR